MNDEIKEENKQIQPIKKKRGRPKKYNKITPIINLNIEKDLFLFIPYCEEKNKEIDKFQLELEEILNVKNKTDEERINDINEIDKLKNIIKDQIVIIDKYKHKYNDIKIYTDKIRSIIIDCPFKLNKDKTIIIPEYTEICCFHDSCKIKGKPIFLPEKVENGYFYIIGWFCSLNCAITYNFNIKDNKVNQRLSLLKQLYKIPKDIKPAPSNKLLKKYGGKLTIEEYRDLFYDKFNNYNMVISPIKCLNFYLEKF